MGKKRGPVWNYFTKMSDGTKCKFCSQKYTVGNANKMERHLSNSCKNCPIAVKTLFSTKKSPVTVKQVLPSSTPKKVDRDTPRSARSSIDFGNPISPAVSNVTNVSDSDTAVSSMSMSLNLHSFLDHIDVQTNDNLNQSLARAIFVSGCPLSLVEHPLWKELFKKLRPAYTLPTRKTLSTTLLEMEYLQQKNQVDNAIKESNYLNLQCDGWSNVRNESIINFVITKPEPLFVEFVMTGDNKHDAKYLFEEIDKVLIKYDPKKFLVIIADNAANMRASLKLLHEKYSFLVTLGCLAHLLHLLCGDILKCKTITEFMKQVTELIACIKRSHKLCAIFTKISKEKNVNVSLKFPVNTRWGSHLFALESLMANKVVLQVMAIEATEPLPQDIKRRVLDEGVFWTRVEKMIGILKPIVQTLTTLEGNEPQIHRVLPLMINLETIVISEIPLSPLNKAEEKHIKEKFQERKDFAINTIHLAADLLNPASKGHSLNASELIDALEFICKTGSNMGFESLNIKKQVADYRDKSALFQKQFMWEDLEKMCPSLWWRTLRGTCDLAEVALKILGAPTSSAATERTFSTFAWIHSNRRNRLCSDRAAKITYISQNWKLLHRPPKLELIEEDDENDDGEVERDNDDGEEVDEVNDDGEEEMEDEDDYSDF